MIEKILPQDVPGGVRFPTEQDVQDKINELVDAVNKQEVKFQYLEDLIIQHLSDH